MASYNRVVLVGHTTQDPELRQTSNNKPVCEVGLAINERFKKVDEWVEDVTFVEVTYWGRTAEVVVEYCPKGTLLLVEGRLQLNTWEKDGEKRSKLRVVARQMQMLGGSRKGDSQFSDQTNAANPQSIGAGSDGDEVVY